MIDEFTTDFSIRNVELEVIPIMFEKKISKYDWARLRQPEVIRFCDNLTDAVVYQFRAYVLGESQKPIQFEGVPTSWWQMLKRDHAPAWFLKRFPAKCKTVTIDAKVFYPDLKVSVPTRESRICVVFHVRQEPPGF